MHSTKNELKFLTRGEAAKVLHVEPHSIDKMRKADRLIWKAVTRNARDVFMYSSLSVDKLASERKAKINSEKKQKKMSFATADRKELKKISGAGIVETAALLLSKHKYLISIQQCIGDNGNVADPAWQARASKASKDFSGYDEVSVSDNNPMEALRLLVLKLARRHNIKS